MNVQNNYPIVIATEGGAQENFREVPMANNAMLYWGSFFDPFTGTNGAQSFAANQNIRGVVVDIMTFFNGQYVSVADLATRGVVMPGTYVAPTGVFNAKYTTGAANVTAAYPDKVVYEPLDITSSCVATLGASGVPVVRGTTANSNVLNTFIEPDPTYPWMLLESGVSATATGLNFQIVGRDQSSKTKVIVKLINDTGAVA